MASDQRACPVDAYVGIGSNLNDPRSQIRRAVAELARLPESRLSAVSGLYLTTPLGPEGQPQYLNAALRLETRLAPLDLLRALQQLELAHGRVRDGVRWGPRTLDLDILLFGDQRIDLPGLRVPHPELGHRAFVLVPLSDLVPGRFQIPGQGRLQDLLDLLPLDGVVPAPAAAGMSPWNR
jgi:2-amino-4-hydroxy-6-hydroxymethyldihydropteridine diphosphokinase